jgi:hypothetical protein
MAGQFGRRTHFNRLACASMLIAGLTCSAILLAAGCGDNADGVTRLSPRGVPYLTGVAVPAGFTLVEKNTEDYESGAQRWARHLYRGNAGVTAVRNFYRDQMPLMGWNRVSEQNVKGTVSLRFEKPSESCAVQIAPTGFFNWSTIQVVVMPFSRNPTEPPSRRPMP